MRDSLASVHFTGAFMSMSSIHLYEIMAASLKYPGRARLFKAGISLAYLRSYWKTSNKGGFDYQLPGSGFALRRDERLHGFATSPGVS